MPTKLMLIRHGSTDWNIKKRYCGWADLGLSQAGRRQVKKLCLRLSKEKFHKIYSSDRKRAQQTARIAFAGAQFEIVPDLREIHFGVFEGLTHRQILKKYAKVYRQWLKDPYSVTIPKGEALADFKKRVTVALKKIIRENKNKTIAVVCHGGAISIYINSILKSKKFWEQIPKSASISLVECADNRAKVKLFNDVRHLNE